MRRGVRFPAWYLLLVAVPGVNYVGNAPAYLIVAVQVAVLGILSGCQSLRDLERYS